MRAGWIVSCVIGFAVVLFAVPAAGSWPVDGAPVCVAQGADKNISHVAADGDDAIFVAWEHVGPARQVRVQRLQADGTPTPGWAPEGVSPASAGSQVCTGVMVLPDGAGGCFVAWHEAHPAGDQVRAVHLTSAGIADPMWPAGGLVVELGYTNPNDVSNYLYLKGIAPSADGGFLVLVGHIVQGCYNGHHCITTVGFTDLIRVSPTAQRSTPVEVVHSTVSAAELISVSDGDDGLFALTRRHGDMSWFRHLRGGGEPGVPTPVNASPFESALARLSDGSVFAVLQHFVWPNWVVSLFHWNPDGSPAEGSPAAGVALPVTGSWSIAVSALRTYPPVFLRTFPPAVPVA